MGKSKYVIFLDVDGTLVDSSYVPTDRVVEAIKKAQSAGHKIFINTARQKRTVPEAIKQKISPDGYVCTTGQYVEVEGKVIKNLAFPPEFALVALELIKKKKYSGNIALNDYDIPLVKGVYNEELARKDAETGRIVKLNLHERLDDEAREVLGEFLAVFQYPQTCETALLGCNKAEGIKCVMDYYGLDICRSIAIGDSINDIDMLSGAGLGVAMGNAAPALKEIAGYITESIANDGVAVALEKLLSL